MSTSRNISAQRPTVADIESAALTSLHNSRQASLPRSSLSKSKTSRKQTPAAVPSVSSQRTKSQPRRPATSDATSTSSSAYRQTFAFPSSSSPLPGPSASSPATSPASSSLSRNASLPASLFHNAPPSNIPTHSASASISQTRPSLSFPSPPTPIVPSIPLRHATQHSPASTSFVPAIAAPPTPSSPYSIPARPSIDFHSSPKRPYAEHRPSAESLATASDPNLASHSAASTPVIGPESNQCSLPLKQLLAKPANTSQIQTGNGPEVPPPTTLHKRSISATESTQYATPRRNSDIAAIELAAIRALRPRPSKPSVRDKKDNDGYHYRRAADSANKHYPAEKEERKIGTRDVGESGWWPDWSNNEENERKSEKDKRKTKLPGSSKASEPHDPSPRGPRLSRSFSTSSLFKRAGFFQPRGSTIRSMSPTSRPSVSPQPVPSDISGSPSPVIFSDVTDRGHPLQNPQRSHVDRAASQQQIARHLDSGNHTDTSRNVATGFVPTSTTAPSRVSKHASPSPSAVAPSFPSSLGPGLPRQLMSPSLSTISSGSGSGSPILKRRQSRDSKALSPAGAVADAYKREQSVKDSAGSAPSRPPRPVSPELPPTGGGGDPDPDLGDKLQPPKPIVDPDASQPGSQRSSRSGLSYAEVQAGGDDVAEKSSTPSTGGTRDSVRGLQQPTLETDGVSVTKETTTRTSLLQSPYSSEKLSFSRSNTSSPLASPPPRPSGNDGRQRNRLKKVRHTSDQSGEHSPYYTVVGARSDRVFAVGGPRDSFGANYTGLEKPAWGVTTTITAGAAAAPDVGDKPSLGRSLSRKLSGKFRKERPAGRSEEGTEPARGRPTWQDGRAPPVLARPSFSNESPGEKDSDDRCLPYLYSLKKHAQSETDMQKEREREKEGEQGKSEGMFPRFWRLFGRSKSKERSAEDLKTDEPPPLPALPKHYTSPPNDIYTPVYSRRERGEDTPSPRARKSPRSAKSSGPTTPSGRPSTATRSSTSDVPSGRFWSKSARSSLSSLDDIPPMPTPLPNLTRYATADDIDSRHPKSPKAIQNPRNKHANPEDGPGKTHTDVGRSDSPPIPLFSTIDAINSFPPRRSSDRSKNSPTSASSASPTSPPPHAPPRPARSTQRPKTAIHSRTNSFGDEPLYPFVMQQATRSIPKMTFRPIDSERRQALTEQEKAARWNALLEKSDAAGGTLHFGGDDDKLPSDNLRFSRTLSELAQDDE